jgi:hypothetical protein
VTGNGASLTAATMSVKANGNVGIGTTSPISLLALSAPQSVLTLQSTSNGAFTDVQFVSKNSDGSNNTWLEGTNIWNDNAFQWATGPAGDFANQNVFMTLTSSGNLGIGTSTPWRTLSVTGSVGFDGLTGSTGSGSLCLDANKQVVYNAGSDNCLSSLRSTKHDINNLTLSGTSMVAALKPVSFIYNNDASSTVRYGFIAEDAAAVDSHFGTYDQSGKLSGVDDRAILSIIVRALQEIIAAVNSLEATVAGFAQNFTTKTLNSEQDNTNQLCVNDTSGKTCISRAQLDAILAGTGQAPSNPVQISAGSFTVASSSPSSNEATTTSTTTDTIIAASSTPATSPPTDATTSAATSTSQ